MITHLKFKKVFLLFVLVASLSSCLTNIDEEEIVDPGTEDPCATITYTINVKPIIDTHCIGCHSSGGGQVPNLESYSGLAANAASVKSEVVSKDMPIGSTLTNEEIQAISCWVDAGALNN